MNNIQPLTDKAAAGFSIICALHCLALPLIALALPSLHFLTSQETLIHQVLLFLVIPTSAIALGIGCKQHKKSLVIFLGAISIGVLVFAGVFAHDLLSETGEKVLTLLGASLLTLTHFINHKASVSTQASQRQCISNCGLIK